MKLNVKELENVYISKQFSVNESELNNTLRKYELLNGELDKKERFKERLNQYIPRLEKDED
mgnify:CR=1 FL=1